MLWKRDTLAAFTEGSVMNFGHAFQSVLPKPQLIQFSRLLFKRIVHPRRAIVWQHTLSNCPGWVFVQVLNACVPVCVCVSVCVCGVCVCVESHFYMSDDNRALCMWVICLHVNPCVHMHACVRVDTLSGGFHIAQQKGSVVALCAQSYKRGFLKHICPLHGVLIRLSISPPDTRTHNHAGCCCKTIIFTFLFCSCIHSFLTAKSVCGFRLSLKTARSRRLPVTGPMQHVLQQHSSGFPPVYTC